MFKNSPPPVPPERSESGNRLPLRWAVIIGVATAVGFIVHAAAGPAAAVTATLVAIGVLHAALA